MGFGDDVAKWVAETEARTAAVFKSSAQALANEVRKPRGAGGHMPIDTGNLRRSLMASTTAMPTTGKSDQKYSAADDVAGVIATAKLGETIYLGFQANYARRVNYGFTGTDSLGRKYNQSGAQFVGLAAQRWPQIVMEQATEIRQKVQARAAP